MLSGGGELRFERGDDVAQPLRIRIPPINRGATILTQGVTSASAAAGASPVRAGRAEPTRSKAIWVGSRVASSEIRPQSSWDSRVFAGTTLSPGLEKQSAWT
jgi:hypothetical protein